MPELDANEYYIRPGQWIHDALPTNCLDGSATFDGDLYFAGAGSIRIDGNFEKVPKFNWYSKGGIKHFFHVPNGHPIETKNGITYIVKL